MNPKTDETHSRALRSWVESANGHSDFPIQNLPMGIFSTGGVRRGGVAIGDKVLDLLSLAESELLDGDSHTGALAASGKSLNAYFGLPSSTRRAFRKSLSAILSDESLRPAVEFMLHPAEACVMHLPAEIGDYTDFYTGIHHARNVGALFRPDNPLLPNYKHVPIGYHGRASSVRVEGMPIGRPSGQLKAADDAQPVFAPSKRLDYELELGVWIGQGTALGEPLPINRAEEHFAGLCLLNDWSARDIQAWEYQPLGPFLSKSFHTTVSPWIVTAEALAPFRAPPPARPDGDPEPLGYLQDPNDKALGGVDVALDVWLQTQQMRERGFGAIRLSRGSSLQNMYWTIAQMIAHQASNGCNLNSGDLLGTGTLSGERPDSFGSLLEITRGGAKPLKLPSGEVRTFLEDGDVVSITGRLTAKGFVSIGFGPCRGVIATLA